jgi:hypothetical protein
MADAEPSTARQQRLRALLNVRVAVQQFADSEIMAPQGGRSEERLQ